MLAKDVFKKVSTDAVKNIIFYGIGALVILFIGNTIHLRLLALILAGIFTLTMLLSLIPFIISFVAGLVASVLAIMEAAKGNRRELRKEGYLWAGTIVQLVENIICLWYVFYLYRAFF